MIGQTRTRSTKSATAALLKAVRVQRGERIGFVASHAARVHVKKAESCHLYINPEWDRFLPLGPPLERQWLPTRQWSIEEQLPLWEIPIMRSVEVQPLPLRWSKNGLVGRAPVGRCTRTVNLFRQDF